MTITVKNAKVTVNAPAFMSHRDIEKFVSAKKDWINRHLKKQEIQEELKKDFMPAHGSEILYRGRSLIIQPADITEASVYEDRLVVPESLSAHELKRTVMDFYKKEADLLIKTKVEKYSKSMGLIPSRVRITGAKTRWGSCSSKGSVNFSWYLIMAPEEQIDYVVVHELAHIREMNHSGRFWSIVEKFMPDYKSRRKRLKALHQRLLTENWDPTGYA